MAFPAGYPTGVQAPVINPTLPYEGPITDAMSPGKIIFISGCVHDGADRFHVNLQCGEGGPPRPDVAFHFNPRFMAAKVVRNTLVNQNWGGEEKDDPGTFPFGHKENFEIIIMCEADGYKTAVNGQPFIEYKHRLEDLSCINTIAIDGMCDIFAIRFEAGDPMPNFESEPKINPPVPFECPIDGGLGHGRMIYVSGYVNEDSPDRFHINLQCGPGEAKPRCNVAFHFNPRFAAQKIVRNALANQKWGGEETETPDFPFVPGGFFEVILLCQEDGYRAAVNGVHMIEFAHRQPCEDVNTLFIKGAIRLTQVRIQ
ncbi:galectin-8-like [Amphiura filiformis]|uniref:galectin-8-like n=1 Tax=Amphiura filiformis TaxID=82378 RepID=UPI003B21BEC6